MHIATTPMAAGSILVRSIVLSTADRLAHSQGPVTPVSVISAVMTILDTYKNLRGLQKRELLVATIDILARGSDGVEGTADDLVPPEVARVLRDLLSSNTIVDIVNHLIAMRTKVPAWMMQLSRCLPCLARIG
jgi:hypothetical protein